MAADSMATDITAGVGDSGAKVCPLLTRQHSILHRTAGLLPQGHGAGGIFFRTAFHARESRVGATLPSPLFVVAGPEIRVPAVRARRPQEWQVHLWMPGGSRDFTAIPVQAIPGAKLGHHCADLFRIFAP